MAASTATLNSAPCSICKFPILIPENASLGQQIKCPSCGAINEVIAQVSIPTSVFVGIICFAAGAILGPALAATTRGGSQWLTRLAKEHIK